MNTEAVKLLTGRADFLRLASLALVSASQVTRRDSRELRSRHRLLVAWMGRRTNEYVEARLRRIIRSKLFLGLLPYNRATIIYGGRGEGGTCNVCKLPLMAAQLVMDVPFGKTLVYLHADCFILWDEERCAAMAARTS